MTGSDVEREFINLLSDQYDYACLRAPGSGGRTQRERPDAVALQATGDGGCSGFAVELKKRPDGTVTFSESEITELVWWAKKAGVTPVVVVKPDLRKFDDWLVMHTPDLHETEQGYSIRMQDHERCRSISEVFG